MRSTSHSAHLDTEIYMATSCTAHRVQSHRSLHTLLGTMTLTVPQHHSEHKPLDRGMPAVGSKIDDEFDDFALQPDQIDV